MVIKIIKLFLNDIQIKQSNLSKIRDHLVRLFPNHDELHGHLPEGKFNYKYPRIQYRVIDGVVCLIGIREGLEVLKEIAVKLDGHTIETEECLGISENNIGYEFQSHWMALNQKNFCEYKNVKDKQKYLRILLKGNLKTLAKGFNYFIPNIQSLMVFGSFVEQEITFKKMRMLGFKGKFILNFEIPDYLALGKQIARGFGVIKKLVRRKND